MRIGISWKTLSMELLMIQMQKIGEEPMQEPNLSQKLYGPPWLARTILALMPFPGVTV